MKPGNRPAIQDIENRVAALIRNEIAQFRANHGNAQILRNVCVGIQTVS
jgi:hypothetical protein